MRWITKYHKRTKIISNNLAISPAYKTISYALVYMAPKQHVIQELLLKNKTFVEIFGKYSNDTSVVIYQYL